MIKFPIGEKRLPSIYTDPLLMDQLYTQFDKSMLSFLSAFQALFSCLSNKQDCSYSSRYLIYDQSLYTTCTVLAYYYLLIWQVHITFLNFLVAHCLALISKNVCMCETGISKFCHKHECFHFYSRQYNINLICTKFVTFAVICAIVPKGWCCPLYYVYLLPV